MSGDGPTKFGFNYGPMCVERVAHDDRLGYVVTIRPHGLHKPSVTVRCSPKGHVWNVQAVECDSVRDILWTSSPEPDKGGAK